LLDPQRRLLEDACQFLLNVESRVDHARFGRKLENDVVGCFDWLLQALAPDAHIASATDSERAGCAGWVSEPSTCERVVQDA
jgi:hypothetical protein